MSKNRKSKDIYSMLADQIIDSGVDVNQMFEKDVIYPVNLGHF